MARKRKGSVSTSGRRYTRSSRSSSLQEDNESEPPAESIDSPKQSETETKVGHNMSGEIQCDEIDTNSKDNESLSEHQDVSSSTEETSHSEEKTNSGIIALDIQQIVLGDVGAGEVRVGKGDEIIVSHGEEVMWNRDLEEVVYESVDVEEPSSEVEDDSDHFIEENDEGEQLIIMNEDGEMFDDKDNRYVIVVNEDYECSNDVQGIVDLSELPEGSCEIITVVRESDNENSQESTEIHCDNINDVIGTSDGVIHNISISQYHSDDENIAPADSEENCEENNDEEPVTVHYFSQIIKDQSESLRNEDNESNLKEDGKYTVSTSEDNINIVTFENVTKELNDTVKELKLENNESEKYESEKTGANSLYLGSPSRFTDIKNDAEGSCDKKLTVFQNQKCDKYKSEFVTSSSVINVKEIELKEIKTEELSENNSFGNLITTNLKSSQLGNDKSVFNYNEAESLQDNTTHKFKPSLKYENLSQKICLEDKLSIKLNPEISTLSFKEHELVKDTSCKSSEEYKLVLDNMSNLLNNEESKNVGKSQQLDCISKNQKGALTEDTGTQESSQDMDISVESSDEGIKLDSNVENKKLQGLSSEESQSQFDKDVIVKSQILRDSHDGSQSDQNNDSNKTRESKSIKSDLSKTEAILPESSIKDNDEEKRTTFRSRSGSTDTTGSDSGSNSGSGRRRSSRLKSIGMSKQSDGDGGGKLSLSGPQVIPATPPVPGYELDKPVKVKSRWRRSSELEMGGGTKRSYDIDINSSLHSRFTDSDNTVTPPRPFQPTTPPSPSPSDKTQSEDKEVHEKLRNFQQISSNMYLTERSKSKDAKRMVCDCILTKEEISRGEIGCGEDCLNRLLMIECGTRCSVGDKCGNKRFQNLEYAKCEIFKTQKKGFGLRSVEDIPVDTFILEYVGEVLDPKEFRRRAKEYSKDKNLHYYFMALKSDSIIDATLKGNLSRFINHSCDPNAETQKWTVNGELRIGFFSKRNIKAGEEITFDYQLQRYGKEAQRCYCGTSQCRGWIGEDPDKEGKWSDSNSRKERKEREYRKKKEEKRRDIKERLNDMDLEEEIEKLVGSGLKNRAHTLTLCRLMVRAEDHSSRSQLLKLIQRGDTACLRLFLDYHGLRLIWSWMMDPSTRSDFKIEIMQTLSKLPIPNKTMLQDSKVLSVIEKWSTSALSLSASDKERSSTDEESDKSKDDEVKDMEIEDTDSNKPSQDLTITDTSTDKPVETQTEGTKKEQIQEDSNLPKSLEFANNLLTEWLSLKEVFRIPKKERIEQMKEHEREADKIYKESSEREDRRDKQSYDRHWSSHDRYRSDYDKRDRDRDRDRERDRDRDRDRERDRDRDRERDRDRDRDRKRVRESPDIDRSRKSRMEDRNDPPLPKMSKNERRHLFEMKVAQEEKEERHRRQQEEIWQQQQEQCIDPNFNQNGFPCYFDPVSQTWMQYHPDPNRVHPQHGTEREMGKSIFPSNPNNPPGFMYNQNRPPFIEPNHPPPPFPPPSSMFTHPPPLPKQPLLPLPNHPPLPTQPPCAFPSDINLPQSQFQPPLPQFTQPPPFHPPLPSNQLNTVHQQVYPPPLSQTPTNFQPPLPSPAQTLPNTLQFQPPLPQAASKTGQYPATLPHLQSSNLPPQFSALSPIQPPTNTSVQFQSVIPHTPSSTSLGTLPSSQAPPTSSVLFQPPVPQTAQFPTQTALTFPDTQSTTTMSTTAPPVPVYIPKPVKLPPKWKSAKDGEGRTYYYHVKTRVSQWEPPIWEQPNTNVLESDSSSESSESEEESSSEEEEEEQEEKEEEEEEKEEEEYAVEDFENEFTELPEEPETLSFVEDAVMEDKRKRSTSLVQERIISPRTEEETIDGKAERLRYKEIKEQLRREKAKQKEKIRTIKVRRIMIKDRSRASKCEADTSSDPGRKIKDNFRLNMAGVIVHYLNPFRKPDCKMGRITNTEDFKHLARKLTHFVMLKELKHCRSVDELDCNDNVKHKARDFIKKYMAKFGSVYHRNSDDD